MKMEKWKDIPGYSGLYQASTFGIIKTLGKEYKRRNGVLDRKHENFLKPSITSNGYLRLMLCKDAERKNFSVHRLIAFTFLLNSENKPCVNHLNGNKTDNRIQNLAWVTASENELHSYKILGKQNWLKNIETNKHPRARKILQMDLSSNIIKKWGSMSEASLNNKFDISAITRCCQNKLKKHRGFKFKYG